MKNIFEYFRIRARFRIVYSIITLLFVVSILQSFYHINLMHREIDEIYNNRLVGINNLVEAKSNLYKTILIISQSLYADEEYDFTVQTQRIQTMIDNVKQVEDHFNVFKKIFENKENDYQTQIETFNHNYNIIFKLTKKIEPLVRNTNSSETNAKELFFNQYVPAFNTLQETLDQLTVLSQNDAKIRYEASIGIFGKMKLYSIIIFSIVIVFILISGYLLSESMINPLKEVQYTLKLLNTGNLPESIRFGSLNKINEIKIELNQLVDNLRNVALFAQEISKGNLHSNFKSLGNNDLLGNALLGMQQSLVNARNEEKERRRAEERQNWKTNGVAQFSDILRQSTRDINELADTIIGKLVHYLDANQGGIFILNKDNPDNPYLELISAYAFNRKKFFSRKIEPGVGLVGTCARERKTNYITEIPNDYIRIASGFGSTNPNALLLVPMVIEENLFGVIELASFNEFKDYHIEFAEHIAQSIASSLSSVQINNRTARLLEESRQKSEKLEEQERDLMNNLQELQNVQHMVERTHKELKTLKTGLTDNLYYIQCEPDSSIDYINTKLLETLDLNADTMLGVRLSFYIKNIENYGIFKNFWRDVLKSDSMHAKFEFAIPGRTKRMSGVFITFKNMSNDLINIALYCYDAADAADFKYLEEEI